MILACAPVPRGGDPVGRPAPGRAKAASWVVLLRAVAKVLSPRPGKLLPAPLKMDDFWGFTPGFGAPPSEGLTVTRAAAPMHNPHSFTNLLSTHTIGNPAHGVSDAENGFAERLELQTRPRREFR